MAEATVKQKFIYSSNVGVAAVSRFNLKKLEKEELKQHTEMVHQEETK